MSLSFAEISRKNAEAFDALKAAPVAVFVGGTSGIGQGMAEVLAKHRKGRVHIVLVGRNETAATNVLDGLTKASASDISSTEQWTHEFVQCDASLLKNVQSASQRILEKYERINYLVLSPGYFTSEREESEEGIPSTLALFYYARWKFINDLLPALHKAREGGQDARVLSVYAGGTGGKSICSNDLGFKNSSNIGDMRTATATYNDLMIAVSA